MGHSLLLDTCVVIPHWKILMAKQGFSSLFTIKKKSYTMTKKDNNNNFRRDYGGTLLIRPPTGHGNLSVLTGVKAYHSLVLHTRALLLHRLTQSDQTEEKTSKLTNKRPPRTDWQPREQLHNYSQFDPFLICRSVRDISQAFTQHYWMMFAIVALIRNTDRR